eukprot:TRINITY_DN7395_c0_g1_i6.p1 TRINITY_DN7395_c0_g1~~TRINITY_DN7395_c0_g1_i6.p1  ORF type:complete len:390 (+),score=60.37 TRINITY_DN7395_c0_g1_i6:106-1275(+)
MSFVQRRGTHANPGANVLSRRFIQVHVKSITGRWHTISAKTTDTVSLIKSEVRSKEGPGDYRGKGLMFVHDSPEWQNVVHRGEILSDTQSLQRAGVSDGAELHVVRKRRLVPQAKESCGHCLEAPCVHNEAENQYAPDLHWSNAYGWSFPGERDYETHELIDPEFEVQMPSGRLKAQRLRTGPQHNRGDLALVMQPDRDLRESHENELRGSDEGLRESGEHSSLLEEDGASSKVAPMSEDRGLEGQSEAGPDVSDSDSEEHRTHKPRGSRCCRPKKWCRQYCHEVSLGFKQVAAGWWDLIFKPSESEFEPSEGFKDALEKTIDTETCLNLSYQDLGHPYQWQYFVRMVPSFELLKDLNLSNNNLRKLPGFDMPLLQVCCYYNVSIYCFP